jgi:hypothetical protein
MKGVCVRQPRYTLYLCVCVSTCANLTEMDDDRPELLLMNPQNNLKIRNKIYSVNDLLYSSEKMFLFATFILSDKSLVRICRNSKLCC